MRTTIYIWLRQRGGGVRYPYRGQHDIPKRASVGRGKRRPLLGHLTQAFRRPEGQGEFQHAGLSEHADVTRRKANSSLDLLRTLGGERSAKAKERGMLQFWLSSVR